MKFTKMQGLGNDYIYVNCLEETVEDPSGTARKISDRHFGVGSDGLVLILPDEQADFRMRMFNSDGSESEMCGNAARTNGHTNRTLWIQVYFAPSVSFRTTAAKRSFSRMQSYRDAFIRSSMYQH